MEVHMLERFPQSDPPPSQPPSPINVHVDLSGLAAAIWQTFIDHLGDISGVAWAGIRDHLSEIGAAIWTPLSAWLEAGLRSAAEETWNGIFGAVPLLLSQLPPALTTDLPAYRAIATDPLLVALALAIPLATGQAGFLAAAAFGIAGLQAAYDLVGLLGAGRGGGHLAGAGDAIALGRLAARAGGGGGAAAPAAIPANRLTTLAEQYGYA